MTADILFDKIYPVAPQMMKRAIILAFHLVQHENEVKNLEWSHFDQGNRKVSFTRTKTDEPVVIDYSCNSALIDFLNNLIASRRELSPYIICQNSKTGWVPYSHFRSMWNRALNAGGYSDGEFKFKEIRHLANTLMKDANITADKRRAMTGHKTNQANEVYTHPTGNDTVETGRTLSH